MIYQWYLQRLTWLIQKRLDASALGIPIEIIAEEVANTAIVKVRAEVFGELKSCVVELDVPRGPWQALKACFGLPYRKQHVYLTATQVFPDLRLPRNQKTCVYMEAENDPT